MVQVRHPVKLCPAAARRAVGAGTAGCQGGQRTDCGEPAWMDCKSPGNCLQRGTEVGPRPGDCLDCQRPGVDRQPADGQSGSNVHHAHLIKAVGRRYEAGNVGGRRKQQAVT